MTLFLRTLLKFVDSFRTPFTECFLNPCRSYCAYLGIPPVKLSYNGYYYLKNTRFSTLIPDYNKI